MPKTTRAQAGISLTCLPVLLALAGCGGGGGAPAESTVDQVRVLAASRGLTGNPAAGRDLPSIHEPLARLGMQLFFTKALAGDMDSACVTCHHPMLGGGDAMSLSIGVDAQVPDMLGPGRAHTPGSVGFDGGPTHPRNAPTTFNVGLWDRCLFHDCRVESLARRSGMNGQGGGIVTPDSVDDAPDPHAGATLPAALARFPVTAQDEMRGHTFMAGRDNDAVRGALERRLQGVTGELPENRWPAMFRAGLEDPDGTAAELITYDNVAAALGAYMRSQVFVNTPWRAFLDGDDGALSAAAQRGALLFFRDYDEGGANCAACHSGDFFTDEEFHVIAMPQVGRGNGDHNGATDTDDFGRLRLTGRPGDRYAFRTPTLLNVAVTGPWGHAGAYTSLEAVVRHHLNPEAAVANYDFGQLDPAVQTADMQTNTRFALDRLAHRRATGDAVLQNVTLTDTQVDQLVAFLESLTDPCVRDRQCLAPWIPDETVPDPDGLRLDAVDGGMHPL